MGFYMGACAWLKKGRIERGGGGKARARASEGRGLGGGGAGRRRELEEHVDRTGEGTRRIKEKRGGGGREMRVWDDDESQGQERAWSDSSKNGDMDECVERGRAAFCSEKGRETKLVAKI